MQNRKSITEQEIRTYLSTSQFQFPPLKIVDVEVEPTFPEEDGKSRRLDALLSMSWGRGTYQFGVEVRRLWTPKAIEAAVDVARKNANIAHVNPMIVVPYLDEQKILALECQGVSGIDLCGNGVVIVPDKLLALRTGFPNQFRWQGAIKNVYRKNSSVAARAFLLVPQYESVNEVLAEIRRRGGEVTVATVSKVCKRLEADLVIERNPGDNSKTQRLCLLQAEKLLDLLKDNYTPPNNRRSFQGKFSHSPDELESRLAKWRGTGNRNVIRTGSGSVEAYAVMAREPVLSFYCTDIESLLASLGDTVRETDRFANLTIQETLDAFVYFDARPGLLASPIQSYLELANGDKREKETAEQVRKVILEPLTRESGENP